MMAEFKVYKSHITVGGGGKTEVAKRLDSLLAARGWLETKFETQIKVDENVYESPTHKVDCFKNRIALELEWSNKDPFFDRDLNNFRLLFDLRAISVGIIVTKSNVLRPIFEGLGVWQKYGTSTTWINKLIPRIEGGGGGGCPVLVLGITDNQYVDNL